MQFALDATGARIEPRTGARGTCDICRSAMIAKCGSIVVHHWAHESVAECDPWWEPEGPWHRNWKECFPAECREVVLPPHRADIRLPNKLVIELQSSSISTADIRAREAHYETMIWVFDAVEAHREKRIDYIDHDQKAEFRWKHPRRSLFDCAKPVYLDLGAGRILYVRKFRQDGETACSGSGVLDWRDSFVRRMTAYPDRAIRNWLAA